MAVAARLSIVVSALAFSLVLSGCDRTTNIRPGEWDYPVTKAHPTRLIELSLLIPDGLRLSLTAVYTTNYGRGMSSKPTTCHYATRSGSATEYSIKQNEFSVSVPLNLTFDRIEPDMPEHSRGRKRHRVSIAVDRFQPGRCLWVLDRVVYSTGDVAIYEQQLFRTDYRGNKPGLDSEALQVLGPALTSFWCTTRTRTREMPTHQVCSGPRSDSKYSNRPTRLTADDVVFTREQVKDLTLSKEGASIQVEFFDIDDIVPTEYTFRTHY